MSFLTFLFPEKVYALTAGYRADKYVKLAETIPAVLWGVFLGIFLILAVVTTVKLIFGKKVGKTLKTYLIFTSACSGIILALNLLFTLLRDLSIRLLLSMTYSEFNTTYHHENIQLTGNLISFAAPFLTIVGASIFTFLFVNKKMESKIKYFYYSLLSLALIALLICLTAIIAYNGEFELISIYD
jgi:hypothetical protein